MPQALNDVPTGQQFQDVAVGSTFYPFVYRLVSRNVMSGYPCGSSRRALCTTCQPALLPAQRQRDEGADIEDRVQHFLPWLPVARAEKVIIGPSA